MTVHPFESWSKDSQAERFLGIFVKSAIGLKESRDELFTIDGQSYRDKQVVRVGLIETLCSDHLRQNLTGFPSVVPLEIANDNGKQMAGPKISFLKELTSTGGVFFCVALICLRLEVCQHRDSHSNRCRGWMHFCQNSA